MSVGSAVRRVRLAWLLDIDNTGSEAIGTRVLRTGGVGQRDGHREVHVRSRL